MELLIIPYNASALLPAICQACLYWEHPQIFKAQPELERARALKQAWIGKRAGVAAGGFVAYDHDEPVGFCHYAASPFFPMLREYQCGEADENSLFIACLYVAPAAQRQGIGQRLRARVEAQAIREGFSAVETIARTESTDNPSGPLLFWTNNRYTVISSQGEYALVRKTLP